MSKSKSIPVNLVRAKMITYKDYSINGEEAILMTDLMDYPREKTTFAIFFRRLSLLTKVTQEMDWKHWLMPCVSNGKRLLHRLSNNTPRMLGHGCDTDYYDKQLPRCVSKLKRWWEKKTTFLRRKKQLVMFTPSEHPWSQISESWDKSQLIPFPNVLSDTFTRSPEYRALINSFLNKNDTL